MGMKMWMPFPKTLLWSQNHYSLNIHGISLSLKKTQLILTYFLSFIEEKLYSHSFLYKNCILLFTEGGREG